MICFTFLYLKMLPLATGWRMDCKGSRAEGGGKLKGYGSCWGERRQRQRWEAWQR